MLLKIYQAGQPVLRKKAKPVSIECEARIRSKKILPIQVNTWFSISPYSDGSDKKRFRAQESRF